MTPAEIPSTAPHVVVVGAGAAGMMAAAEAARAGARVTLLEKNTKTGVKILMSGGTRCNITHDTDAKGITQAFDHAKRFLQPSIGRFGPSDVIEMFHCLGVETKREETGKIFPVSNRAVDVRDALQRSMLDAGVRLELRCSVKRIQPPSGDQSQWNIATELNGNPQTFLADRVIVTTGGKSWPGCGTTGDGYDWLRALGHTIVAPRPALVPLVGGTETTHALSGLTLPDVNVSVFTSDHRSGKKPKVERRSSWLFTHFGFSGPAAMDVSGVMTAYDRIQDAKMRLDLTPQISEAEIRDVLSKRSGDAGKRTVVNTIQQWVPSRLALAICEQSHPANVHCKLAELPGKECNLLIEKLKRWHLPVNGTRGFAKAEVTAGGVQLSEVDPRTMQSRVQDGLYIAGEILDVDGWIGGYNFQAAFSTGRAAGRAAAHGHDT
ncbi:MAG: NAD(P)/FAD-dependent oxidoreductase [Rhodopirellula sp. JB055]|uniref:NAD(P)/FAD-dependent oxidoreductase n=1 Tax=Rhodopirellula sp. JB055 TaxID=3342846 RepID=UPI00370B1732